MKPFPENLRKSLARVMERANSEYAAITSPAEWPLSAQADELAGAEIVQQALELLGYTVNVQTAYAVWEIYSEDLAAQWIDSPRNVDEALIAIKNLCENIAAGQDYAGFAGA